MRTNRIASFAALAALSLAGTAGAQPVSVVEEQQMVLPPGSTFIQVFLEANLSEDQVFKPFSIAPDLWYGVNELITVGLVHSGRGATGFLGGVGNGLCLAGEENGCGKIYDSVGLMARYHLHQGGGLTVSADGGLFAKSFDPFALALKAGAIIRWQSGSLSLDLSPGVFFGLTERDGGGDPGMVVITSNKEELFLPATLMFAMSPALALAVQLGIATPLEDAGDLWILATSVGVQYMLSEKMMLDAAFSLPITATGLDGAPSGFDVRTFTVGFGYAL